MNPSQIFKTTQSSKRRFSVKVTAEHRPPSQRCVRDRKISHIFICSFKNDSKKEESSEHSVSYVGFDVTSTTRGKKIVDSIERSYADSESSDYHRDLHMCWTTFLFYSAFEPDNLHEWIRNDIDVYRSDLYQMISDTFDNGGPTVERHKLGRWYVIPERELRITHDMLKFNPGGITIAPLKTFYKSACF